jgi:hypothetical protein
LASASQQRLLERAEVAQFVFPSHLAAAAAAADRRQILAEGPLPLFHGRKLPVG